jgi:hypothetical protein
VVEHRHRFLISIGREIPEIGYMGETAVYFVENKRPASKQFHRERTRVDKSESIIIIYTINGRFTQNSRVAVGRQVYYVIYDKISGLADCTHRIE